MNRPTSRKGIPNPVEYERSKKNAISGLVAAKVKIAPKIAPIHGVQPIANAAPNKNETKYFDLNFFVLIFNFLSLSKNLMLTIPATYIPNRIISKPPILDNHFWTINAEPDKNVCNKIPIIEKINEKPSTKNILAINVSHLFIFGTIKF